MASDQTDDSPAWARHIAPSALLLGALTGFVACCLLGYAASRRPTFANVERFHHLLNCESAFYPTASQVYQSVISRLDRSKILVLIGGSSRLHGTSQKLSESWTRRLQDELGDDYQVINLAQRGGKNSEFAGVIAEIIFREHPRMVFITELFPNGIMASRGPSGIYEYFYWDAFYKNLLLSAPERHAMYKTRGDWEDDEVRKQCQSIPPNDELHRRMKLDSYLFFSDLWHWIGYQYAFTVWTPQSPKPFTKPRRSSTDQDGGPIPLDIRYTLPNVQQETKTLQKWLKAMPVVRDAQGDWQGASDARGWLNYRESIPIIFPQQMKDSIELVLLHFGPYQVRHLTDSEQAQYLGYFEVAKRTALSAGFDVLEAGRDFTDADFNDFVHLTPSGGAKLASVVAPRIRSRAKTLGFIP